MPAEKPADKIAANRIKASLSAKLAEYKSATAALADATDDASLQRRFDTANDFKNFLVGMDEAGKIYGASEIESKSVQAVQRAVDIDIQALENQADLLDLLK